MGREIERKTTFWIAITPLLPLLIGYWAAVECELWRRGQHRKDWLRRRWVPRLSECADYCDHGGVEACYQRHLRPASKTNRRSITEEVQYRRRMFKPRTTTPTVSEVEYPVASGECSLALGRDNVIIGRGDARTLSPEDNEILATEGLANPKEPSDNGN